MKRAAVLLVLMLFVVSPGAAVPRAAPPATAAAEEAEAYYLVPAADLARVAELIAAQKAEIERLQKLAGRGCR